MKHIDEVRKGLEKIASCETKFPGDVIDIAQRTLPVLSAHEQEVAEWKWDAERYRALRDKSLGTKPDFAIHVSVGHDWMRVTEIGELDSIVDAALRPFTGDEK